MTSVEKVRQLVTQALNYTDADLAEILPFPVGAGLIRMGIGAIEERLPTDPAELDGLIDKGLQFLGGLRSDA